MGSLRHLLLLAATTLLAFTGALPASAEAVNQPASRFGASIAFTPSAYTPAGITSLAYSPLPSEDRSRFGEPIVFTPSAYTPSGITTPRPLDTAATP